MAWNIGLLCVKAPMSKADDILDIFYKSEEGLYFEDVTSALMETSLGVGEANDWLIILDTQGRFIHEPGFAMTLSKQYKVKTFWIAESLIFRDYHFGLLKKGGLKSEWKGVDQGIKYLHLSGMKAIDEWGETIIFQIIEHEIFNRKIEKYDSSLQNMRYSKYEL
ncbi:hypothetical protein M3231_18450 [Neobacillus mesonae]|nr:hypothetical protein [Neobacillus mesonae]